MYFVITYIVTFHVITALHITLKAPGSLVVDVCSIGVVYLIHHTSYHGLDIRFEARGYVFNLVFSLPLLGCRSVSESRSFVYVCPTCNEVTYILFLCCSSTL